MSKLTAISPQYCTYLLLFSRETPLFGAFGTMIEHISSTGSIVLCVEPSKRSFTLTMLYHRNITSCIVDSVEQLHSMIQNLGKPNRLIAMVYPIVLREWISIINIINPMLWCLPASKFKTYISFDGEEFYTHFIFPWSKSGSPSGFTMGHGKLREGKQREQEKFEARANFYDSMVSSTPLDSSCTDCVAMRQVADTISHVFNVKRPSKKRNLSEGSIVALKELEDRIKELTQ